jgi:putative ABC transport system permease protein
MRWRFFHKAGRQELDREISFHLDEATRANRQAGMSPEEARRQAAIAFGGREQTTQQLREVHASAIGQAILANARAALRFLRKSPSFSLAIILTLALGIGANTAVFSAIDAVLLRPLPFPQGDRLVALGQDNSKAKDPQIHVAPQRLEDWNRLNHTFTAISGYYTQDVSETSDPLPERLRQALIAPRFVEVWGVAPALGHSFTPEEEHFGGPLAVLISDRLWRRHFSAAPDLTGKRLKLGAYSYAVIGVMPASFAFPAREADVWTPSPVDAPYAQSRESTWYQTVGRMKPGVTLEQARVDLATVQRQLGREYPKTDRDLRVTIAPLKNTVIGEAGSSLWLLYGSVTLLLLIACTNVAALLLARTRQREHEISVRFSLGASRAAILTQLLSETFALALVGAMLGLLVAAGAIRILHQLAKALPGVLPRTDEITLNPKILLYTLGCALLATLLCGLLPALRGARRELARSLALGSRTQVSARGMLPWVLVTAQVAFAVTLLVGAGLLLRSFQQLGRVRAGFDPAHVLTLQISGSYGETADMGRLTQRMDRTLDALRATPGVEAAATAAALPGVGGELPAAFKLAEGSQDPNRQILADTRYVSAGYFATLHIPLLRGSACRAGDPAPHFLVNRSFAAAYLGGSDPLGRHLQTGAEHSFAPLPGEIRGVVADAREQGIHEPPTPTVYWCISAPDPSPYFLIRTYGDPVAMADTLRRKIYALEPSRAVYAITPLTEHLAGTQSENRLRTALLTLFAGTAIALASIGIYGTLSYLGRLRQREMGLRLAVGATRWQIAQRFLKQGLRVAAIGCCAGVLLGWLGSHLLTGMLYGVSTADPLTYAGTVLLVALVALLASATPALRAARIHPAQVLRDE